MQHRERARLRGLTGVVALSVAPLLLSGCLGPSYIVERSEIARLERVAPVERAKRVRVVQRFSTADTPPAAAAWSAPLPRPAGPGEARGSAYPMWTQVWISPGPPTYHPLWAPAHLHRTGGVSRGGRGVVASRGTPTRGRGPSSVIPSSGGSGSDTGKELKAALAIAVVAGVAVGVGLAVTEGARYDGWVAVHPQHPVHLMGNGSSHRVVGMDQLSLTDMRPDETAVIVRHEGAGMWLLGRAPLNREGVTYGFDIGTSRIPMLNGRISSLTGGAFRVGLYPNAWLGILPGLDLAFGTFDNDGASVVTPQVQIVAAPAHIWRLHFGVFGEVGWSWANFDALQESLDPSGTRLGAGILLQWEITTRLALDFRWTNRWLPRGGTVTTSSFTTGLSIY